MFSVYRICGRSRAVRRVALVSTLALLCAVTAYAEPDARVPFPDVTERIIGLGRVWAKVKFYHPYLAYKDIDWDAALMAAIPRVESATNVAEYRAAVEGMLAKLGDPATGIVESTAANQAPPPKEWLTTPAPGVLEVKLAAIAFEENDYVAVGDKVKQLTIEAAKAKILVLDLRGWAYEPYVADMILPTLPGVDTWPLVRSLEHRGYRDQASIPGSRYDSAFVTTGARPPMPSRGAAAGHAVFVVDPSSPVPPVAVALQASGRGTIVAHGGLAESNTIGTIRVELPMMLTSEIRVEEQLWGAVVPDIVVSKNQSVELRVRALARSLTTRPVRARSKRLVRLPEMRPRDDLDYPETEYPSREHRLLAGIRMWAVIDEFSAYRYLIADWDAALRTALPQLAAAGDRDAYHRALRVLAVAAGDGHIFLNPAELLKNQGPSPVDVRLIEGKLAIVQLLDPAEARKLGIAIGDVIETIAGAPASAKLAERRDVITGSTEETRDHRAARFVLDGESGTPIAVGVRGVDGRLRDVNLVRSALYRRNSAISTPHWHKLPGNNGYADLTRMTVPEVIAMFADFKGTNAIVFDMRGYPNGTEPALTSRINTRNAKYGAELLSPVRTGKQDGKYDYRLRRLQLLEPSLPRDSLYTGKIVVLIDVRAFSQAEHLCLGVRQASGATFVGSPTQGANGPITTMRLPGGLRLTFTGMEVRHADGRQLQKVGIQPDIVARPTLAGIRAGKDEVLERALTYLATGR